MKTQFTPGPWSACKSIISPAAFVTYGGGFRLEAQGMFSRADAALIATAPEMFALLQDVATIPALQGAPVLDRIAATIARAQGE